jgi:hypothetical protein
MLPSNRPSMPATVLNLDRHKLPMQAQRQTVGQRQLCHGPVRQGGGWNGHTPALSRPAHHQGDQRRLRPPLIPVQTAHLRRVSGDAVGMVMVRPPY